MNREELIARMRELEPWHFDMEVRDGVRTSEGNPEEYGDVDQRGAPLIDPWHLAPLFELLYPEKLAGKHLIDVGCNGGGYCFLGRSLGAERTVGFDPREHWINQAEFVRKNWGRDATGMEFHAKKLAEIDLSAGFDVTVFKGVFYHLPNPIGDLETLCEATREVIILDTACRLDVPEDTLVLNYEVTGPVMSGVDGLCWYPGGPSVVVKSLAYFGFPHARVLGWRDRSSPVSKEKIGRFTVVAGRTPERIARLPERISWEPDPAAERYELRFSVNGFTTVLWSTEESGDYQFVGSAYTPPVDMWQRGPVGVPVQWRAVSHPSGRVIAEGEITRSA